MAQLAFYKYVSIRGTTEDPTASLIGGVRCNVLTTGLTISGLANAEPGADLNTTEIFRVTGTRKVGSICRHIVISRTATIGGVPKLIKVRIPILQQANYVAYISDIYSSINYNGLDDWKFVGATEERNRLYLGNGS